MVYIAMTEFPANSWLSVTISSVAAYAYTQDPFTPCTLASGHYNCLDSV